MREQWLVIDAERIVDGLGSTPIENGRVVIKGDEIIAVGTKFEVEVPDQQGVQTIRARPGQVVMPGLVDVHTHLILPGDGSRYQDVMSLSDGVLLLQAMRNAQAHLMSGVTTLADTGARGSITFDLRDAINLGLCRGPRLVVCGRPLTRTGGHCWFFGGEADGPEEIARTARQLLKDGADIIKVMATGGGTVGTYPHRPSLSLEELSSAASEAHELGKPAIVHTSGTEGTIRSLAAGFDVLFHCHFYEPDGAPRYRADVAQRIAEARAYVNPTLWVNGVRVETLERKSREQTLEDEKSLVLERQVARYDFQKRNVAKLVRAGVRLVAGSDAGWGQYPFGDLVSELDEMVKIGLSPFEALVSATRNAADALGVGHLVGSLAAGKKADILVVDGDPTVDITALRNVSQIISSGRIVK